MELNDRTVDPQKVGSGILSTGAEVPLSADEHDHLLLRRYRNRVGAVFGSDLLAQLLYTVVRMHRPEAVVELGCGLGVSALHMAVALRENGQGTLWTVDDGDSLRERIDVDRLAAKLFEHDMVRTRHHSAEGIVAEIARTLRVADHLVQINAHMDLSSDELLPDLIPDGKKIGLLLSDFHHAPEAILRVLAWALPKMDVASSIFFDSASTWWPSWLLLEKVTDLLSKGHVPPLLRSLGTDLDRAVEGRRFTLVHLPLPGRDQQNGPAWLKIEPHDLVPWPRTTMRSPNGVILGWDA